MTDEGHPFRRETRGVEPSAKTSRVIRLLARIIVALQPERHLTFNQVGCIHGAFVCLAMSFASGVIYWDNLIPSQQDRLLLGLCGVLWAITHLCVAQHTQAKRLRRETDFRLSIFVPIVLVPVLGDILLDLSSDEIL